MGLADTAQDLQGTQPYGTAPGGRLDAPWLTKWYWMPTEVPEPSFLLYEDHTGQCLHVN